MRFFVFMEDILKKIRFIKILVVFSMIFPLGLSKLAMAHFGMVIPSDTMVMQDDNRTINIKLSFSHPFEMIGMQLVKPNAFGVVFNGKNINLLGELKKIKIMNNDAWNVDHKIKRPGIYMFFMEPQPYWEPAEDCFIVHHTKTIVTAFGDDEGWDSEIGLKTEIIPLSKPFGLYTGNLFQGIVKLDGKAVSYAEVEVEYYNEDGKSQAPTDYMITQTIKADQNGVFSYAVPQSGWWGFAALNEADYKIKYDGVDKNVEIGAVIWVKFLDWQKK
ncbi:ATP-dependent DNA ligase [Candidatus Magnetomorum sp. HK-1]|nr:ATP-dependent DNA ligase [Candidatus Magnetomorum sp. HK-1]